MAHNTLKGLGEILISTEVIPVDGYGSLVAQNKGVLGNDFYLREILTENDEDGVAKSLRFFYTLATGESARAPKPWGAVLVPLWYKCNNGQITEYEYQRINVGWLSHKLTRQTYNSAFDFSNRARAKIEDVLSVYNLDPREHNDIVGGKVVVSCSDGHVLGINPSKISNGDAKEIMRRFSEILNRYKENGIERPAIVS